MAVGFCFPPLLNQPVSGNLMSCWMSPKLMPFRGDSPIGSNMSRSWTDERSGGETIGFAMFSPLAIAFASFLNS